MIGIGSLFVKRFHSRAPRLGFFRNSPLNETGGDSILKVDGRLVTSKHLNKAVFKMGRMGLRRETMEFILLSSIRKMPQAIDDVNVTTILTLMLKLRIRSDSLVDALLPFCYRISDFQRLVVCAHLLAMIDGENSRESVKIFLMDTAKRLPLEGYRLTFEDLGRLCESLFIANLYCEDLGKLIMWLLSDELDLENLKVDLVNFASILRYFGRMSLGNASLWRLYNAYVEANLLEADSRILIKVLESFMIRGFRVDSLLRSVGDVFTARMAYLHPIEVAKISEIYVAFNFYHQRLLEQLIQTVERIVLLIDGKNAVKLLKGFIFTYEFRDKGGHAYVTEKMPQRHQRSLLLTLNKCASAVERCDLKELATITKGMNLFGNVKSTKLEQCVKHLIERCLQPTTPAKLAGIVKTDRKGNRSKQLAGIILAEIRQKSLPISPQEACIVSSKLTLTKMISST